MTHVVYFSVKGSDMPDITQIAAKEYEGGAMFSAYVLPEKEISLEAEQVTGLSIDFTQNKEKIMKHNGHDVCAKPCETVLQEFITWMTKLGKICLAAHNVRGFDSKVLVNALQQHNLVTDFMITVPAFSETLRLFKEKLPQRKSYSEESLVKDLIGRPYDSHNAIGDVEALTELLKVVKATPKDMIKYSFPPMECVFQDQFRIQKSQNFLSYQPLIGQGIVKTNMAENIAGSGLSVAHLSLVYKRKNVDGLRDVLSAKNQQNRPRVTDQKKTLDSLVPALAKYFDDCVKK